MKSTRQKMKEHKRRSYLRIFLFFIVIVTVVFIKNFVSHTPLPIGRLEVRPQLTSLNGDDIMFILDLKDPVNILNMDKELLRQKLISDLRIKDAQINYAFPLKLVIEIQENVPVVCLVSQYAFFEVDENNRILKVSRGVSNPNIPILTGVSVESSFVGDKIQSPYAQSVITFLKGLNEDSRAIISEISLKNNVVEILTLSKMRIIMGVPENVANKSSDFNVVMKQIQDQNLAVEYVNLSYERPVIKVMRTNS